MKILFFLTLGLSLSAGDFKERMQSVELPSVFVRFADTKTSSCPKSYKDLSDKGAGFAFSDIDNPLKDVSSSLWSNLSAISDDLDRESLLKAIKTNIEYWQSKPQSFSIKLAGDTYTASDMLKANNDLYSIFSSTMSYTDILNTLKSRFKIYKAVSDDTKDVTITGYYESEIAVKKEKDDRYKYALHFRPPDLVKTNNPDFDYGRYDENGNLVKYYSTEEIRNGVIDSYKLEIAYSNHPSHILLAQIQGSSILRFPDGSYERVGFNGANGWPYVSVQRILMDCGEVPSMNFKDFIKYLSSQPQDREERLVNLNPRYIFFELRNKDSGAVGAISKELTPKRSVAIDPAYIPYGLVAYISSTKPVSDENGERIISFEKFSRFITTHDTGSAIRGAGRIDIFWGNGKKAELEASSMKASASFYLITPKK